MTDGPDMLLTAIAVAGVPAAVLFVTGVLVLIVLIIIGVAAGPEEKPGTRR